MKKLCMLFLAASGVLLFTVCSSAFTLGDVDQNGEIEAADARLALRAAVGLEVLWRNDAFQAADYNRNNKIEADDARGILRVAVGLERVGEIRPETTHIDMRIHGTAFLHIWVSNNTFANVRTDSEEISIAEETYFEDGHEVICILSHRPCENAVLTLSTAEIGGEERTVTVSVREDDSLPFTMVGMEFLPDLGAIRGTPPRTEHIKISNHCSALTMHYVMLSPPDDAERLFYGYADQLERLGYQFDGKVDSVSKGRSPQYCFSNPELTANVIYNEVWDLDDYINPKLLEIWIICQWSNESVSGLPHRTCAPA